MNDNEKLIEEAREQAAMFSANRGALIYRLADALEAAEKELGEATVTPTAHEVITDEREALADLVLRATAPYKMTNGWLAADLILAAGFRRTEVPESNAEAMRDHVCWSLSLRPAQGEPSDAQVDRDYLAQVIHKAVYSRIPLDRLTDEAQNDAYRRADAVLAALRATGGV